MLADAAAGCGAAFGGCGSGCRREDSGLECAADSDVCSVAGEVDGFADCWAVALNVSSNDAEIAQGCIRIAEPDFVFASVEFRSGCAPDSPLASFREGKPRRGLPLLNTGGKNKFRRTLKSHNNKELSGLQLLFFTTGEGNRLRNPFHTQPAVATRRHGEVRQICG